MRALRLLVGFVGLVLAHPAAAAEEPPPDRPPEQDAALIVLDGLGQTPSADELAVILAEDAEPAATTPPWATAEARWQQAADGPSGSEWLVYSRRARWDARIRARRTPAGDRLVGGAGAVRVGGFAVRLGGWTWRHGFGLLVGAAGRSAAWGADAGLGPRSAGARGWTGWPDPRAYDGAVLTLEAAGWSVTGAGGAPQLDAHGAAPWLGSLGRRSGSWRFVAMGAGQDLRGLGACGRWRRGDWSGAWEIAAPTATAGRLPPATAFHAAWRRGRALRVEGLAVSVPPGSQTAVAATQPLIGRAAGTAWALRAVTRLGQGGRLGALLGGARREATAVAGPEQRALTELDGRVRLAPGLILAGRLRVQRGSEPVWSVAWPWLPPRREPARRTETEVVALECGTPAVVWSLGLRSYAVSHSATDGRRFLASVAVRAGDVGGLRWRLAWRQAWGEPVDLADAVSPLPGMLVARHWGAWAGGVFAAAGVRLGHLGLDAAADLRERTDGTRFWEAWVGGRLRW